jgi:DNA repair exonuclease SbcCD ATPase subunit
MITLQSIGIKNFLSFGNSWNFLNLDRPGATLILGENVDIGEAGSRNGVGKTTIFQAIAVALYNQTLGSGPVRIKKDNWINSTNKKEMEVVIEFRKGKVQYKVHRGRKPEFVKLYRRNIFENDWDPGRHDITPDSVANTNSAIEEILGVRFELFKYVVLFTATEVPFLALSGPEQRAIIERLFDMDIITAKAENASGRKSDVKQNLEMAHFKCETTRRNNKKMQDTIQAAEDRLKEWEENRVAEIASISRKLGQIEGIDFEAEEKFHAQLQTARLELQELIQAKGREARRLRDLTAEIERLEEELSALEKEKCPYCGQHHPGAEEKQKETRAEAQRLESQQECQATTYREKSLATDQIQETASKLEDQVSHADLLDLIDIRNQSETMQAKLEELSSVLNPHIDSLAELKRAGLRKIDSTEIEELQDDFKHINFLLRLLQDKNSFIRRRIVGQILPFMNQRLRHFLKVLGLPHLVAFEDNLTVTISQYGRELNYGNLSTGERQRVNLALSFTFREVLSAMHTNFNILLLDEILDAGLDAVGVDNTVVLLKKMGREDKVAIFLVSHREEVSARVDRTLLVQKEQGFSHIVEVQDA